ncbi:unnamed protein product [Penicillium viridicatum]
MKSPASLFITITCALVAPVASFSPPKHIHLKSIRANNQEHNNLYVYAYHTGSGLNDAVLTNDVDTAGTVYLNGTNALFDFNTKPSRSHRLGPDLDNRRPMKRWILCQRLQLPVIGSQRLRWMAR